MSKYKGSIILEERINDFEFSLSSVGKVLEDCTKDDLHKIYNINGDNGNEIIRSLIIEKLEDLHNYIHRIFKNYEIDEEVIIQNDSYIGLETWDFILQEKFYTNDLILKYKEKFQIYNVISSNRFKLREISNLYNQHYTIIINKYLDTIIANYNLDEKEIDDVIQLSTLKYDCYASFGKRCKFIKNQRITKEVYLNNLEFFHQMPAFIEELKNNELISDELRTIIKLREI
ncbi:hypothetical protein Bp8pS_241 [Bacillus phage vB_BpuM-BpSp]|nr:hypothetical protein Bp8pS_241 [Bacillus phage vB_BpuM-BpSp]